MNLIVIVLFSVSLIINELFFVVVKFATWVFFVKTYVQQSWLLIVIICLKWNLENKITTY